MYIIVLLFFCIILFILYILLRNGGESDKCDIPLYYINLDRSHERRNLLIKEFEKFKITNYRRIPGVTPDSIHHRIKDKYKKACPYQTHLEFACLLSHLKAIHTAYINGDKYALIVEDDLKIVRMIDFKNLLKTAPEDWDILQMYVLNGDMFQVDKELWLPYEDFNWASLAYIVNRKGMINVLSSCFHNYKNPKFEELDINWSPFLEMQPCVADFLIYKIAKTYSCNDLFFRPSNEDSTIHTHHIPVHIQHDTKTYNHFLEHGFRNKDIGFLYTDSAPTVNVTNIENLGDKGGLVQVKKISGKGNKL